MDLTRTPSKIDTRNPGKATADAFAKGVCFHKLVWVFTIGCFIGYVAEIIFCIFRHGYIQTRQGMIFGPFSQIYGIAAVVMTLILSPIKKRGCVLVFIVSGLLGSAIELAASYVQEFVFNSRSWDFSDQVFSIQGRTSLMFMFFWAVLGFAFIQWIYPKFSSLIERIPRRPGTVLSWVMVIFFAINISLSATAVLRWHDRLKGKPPQNEYVRFLDSTFPNGTMKEIYPQIEFVR